MENLNIENEIEEIELVILLESLKEYDLETYKKSVKAANIMNKFIDFSSKASVLRNETTKKQCIIGALFHDIGYLYLSKDILKKKRYQLKKIDIAYIKKHPETGYLKIKDYVDSSIVYQMILQHHELLDGTGYPFKLTESKIALESKILCIIDKYIELRSEYDFLVAIELLELEAYARHIDKELCDDFIIFLYGEKVEKQIKEETYL